MQKVLIVSVGSVFEYKDGVKEIVKEIAINFEKSKTVFFESDEWDTVSMPLNENLKNIDGIPVEKILEVINK